MSRLDPLVRRVPQPILDRLRPIAKPLVVKARSVACSTPDAPAVSPYVQWHGPAGPETAVSLICTPVADLLLFQGSAPASADLQLEVKGDESIPIPHRFPHPNDPTGPQTCFELTIDHSTLAGGGDVRLLVDGVSSGEWISAPAVPAPGSMVGVEAFEQCPACTGSNLKPTGRRQHLQMATCQDCQLVMTTPRPAEGDTLIRYSDRYFVEEYLPSQQITPSLLAHIDMILDHCEPAKSLKSDLFELGVGGGNLSARAAERGWTVRGTDVNEASVKHAAGRGLDVWLENADHAADLGGTYGAIVSEMSLEHVRRPEHFCRLAANALTPGGRLVIYTVSAEGSSFEHSGMASPLVGPGEHLFLYSAGSLVALCERVGLRVDSLWRNDTGDEIGIVATRRRDRENPAVATPR